jgi:uncharacterized protein (TIGR03067 family)
MSKPAALLFVIASLPVLALLLGADAPAKVANDLDSLQGRWAVVAADKNGTAMLKTEFETMTFEFEKDVLALRSTRIGDEKGRITLDQNAKPRAMDLVPIKPNNNAPEKPALFIYQLNGDELKLCWSKPGGDRPVDFVGDQKNVLMTLRRIKAATTQPDAK